MQVILEQKPQIKTNSLKKQTHGHLLHTWSDKIVKATIVNRALTSLHGGSFEIALTCPFKAGYNSWKSSWFTEIELFARTTNKDIVTVQLAWFTGVKLLNEARVGSWAMFYKKCSIKNWIESICLKFKFSNSYMFAT